MVFAGINYIAVVVAAVAGFAVGMAWYGVLGTRWMAALGKSKAELMPDNKPPLATMAITFVCELVMAWVLAGVLGHLGEVTLRNGVISAAFIWVGFVFTTQLINHRYGRFPATLTAIDSGHFLAVLLVMGAVIGAFG